MYMCSWYVPESGADNRRQRRWLAKVGQGAKGVQPSVKGVTRRQLLQLRLADNPKRIVLLVVLVVVVDPRVQERQVHVGCGSRLVVAVVGCCVMVVGIECFCWCHFDGFGMCCFGDGAKLFLIPFQRRDSRGFLYHFKQYI